MSERVSVYSDEDEKTIAELSKKLGNGKIVWSVYSVRNSNTGWEASQLEDLEYCFMNYMGYCERVSI